LYFDGFFSTGKPYLAAKIQKNNEKCKKKSIFFTKYLQISFFFHIFAAKWKRSAGAHPVSQNKVETT